MRYLARVARVFVDDSVNKLISGELDTATASMAKYWVTDTQGQIGDRCLQMFGGYGYMTEFPIGCTQTPERNESTGEPTRS
jgi:acyl-CoA dehydrogenase